MSSFSLDISKFNDKVKAAGKAGVKKICLEVMTGVILKTPRDTGRAQSNWFPSVGSPATDTTENTVSTAGGVIARNLPSLDQAYGNIWYLSNNLPYIERLEYGYSRQAPSGMVRLTIDEVKRNYRP